MSGAVRNRLSAIGALTVRERVVAQALGSGVCSCCPLSRSAHVWAILRASSVPQPPTNMSALDRITVDSAVRFGKPTIRGTRVAVVDVLEALAAGQSVEELLDDFPQLAREDVLGCLAYAAERERRVVAA
jgi:uncharacterized protein (DUF433 family)